MPIPFLQQRLTQFHRWWHAPPTRRDRITGAMIGGIGSFWISALGRLMLGPTPIGLATLGLWALAGAIGGILLGLRFPKSVSVVCFPFATFGTGG